MVKDINMEYGFSGSGRTDREFIYHRLKEAIIKGQIKPHERIIETECAEKYHVSRTPIREALRMLERDGLVDYVAKKGAMARAPLKETDVEELFTLRAFLQMYGAENTVKNCTQLDLDEMKECNEKCLAAYQKADMNTFFKYHDKFNYLLMHACRMTMLIRLLEMLENYDPITAFASDVSADKTLLQRGIALPSHIRRYESISEHEKIWEALNERDCEKYKAALRIHLNNVTRACVEGVQSFVSKFEDIE